MQFGDTADYKSALLWPHGRRLGAGRFEHPLNICWTYTVGSFRNQKGMKTTNQFARQNLLIIFSVAAALAAFAAEREIPPAFGPHVNLTAKDFAGSKPFT